MHCKAAFVVVFAILAMFLSPAQTDAFADDQDMAAVLNSAIPAGLLQLLVMVTILLGKLQCNDFLRGHLMLPLFAGHLRC
jgi:ribose/xylose/arabinose/galactoside ABC-type transport system permease subunit